MIDAVRIAQVRPGSPAAKAGLKAGMRVVEFQGIAVVGLSEAEFIRRMDALPASDRLNLKVQGITGDTASLFSVPVAGPAVVTEAPAAAGSLAKTETAAVKADEKSPAAAPAVVKMEMTEAETLKLIETLRRRMQEEMNRVVAEARATGRAQSDPHIMREAIDALKQTPPQHLALLCEAALKAEGELRSGTLRSSLIAAMTSRKDYAPAQKEVVLKYLPKLPELIEILDRMNWVEGTQAVVAAGWKKARQEERDGMLTYRGSRYARIAAKQGLTEALIALAQTVRKPEASKRMPSSLLKDEIETLKALVPMAGDERVALGDFVVKNKSRLVFDAAKGIYDVKK